MAIGLKPPGGRPILMMMIVQGHDLRAAVAHCSLERERVEERLRSWVGDRRPVFPGEEVEEVRDATDRFVPGGRRTAPPRPAVRPPRAPRPRAAEVGEDGLTAKQRTLLLILERLFGLEGAADRVAAAVARTRSCLQAEVTVTVVSSPNGDAVPEPVGWGLEYDRSYHYLDYEHLALDLTGTVITADGRRIEVDLAMTWERRFELEEETHLRLGDAKPIDPIVLDLDGDGPRLAAEGRTSFDLDGDGAEERLPVLAGGDRFLVMDRDGDGAIADGTELFGPASGEGYGELAALDDDGNGWIDAGDAAFADLALWRPGEAGPVSLATAGIGAVATVRFATPFALKDAANATAGLVRGSGLYLYDDGAAGTTHRVDLVA